MELCNRFKTPIRMKILYINTSDCHMNNHSVIILTQNLLNFDTDKKKDEMSFSKWARCWFSDHFDRFSSVKDLSGLFELFTSRTGPFFQELDHTVCAIGIWFPKNKNHLFMNQITLTVLYGCLYALHKDSL